MKLKALLIGLTLVVAGCGSSAVKSDTTTTKPTTTTTFLCPNGEPPTTNPDTSPAQLPFHYHVQQPAPIRRCRRERRRRRSPESCRWPIRRLGRGAEEQAT